MRQQKKEPTIRAVYAPDDAEKQRLQFIYQRYYRMKDHRDGNPENNRTSMSTKWDTWMSQWEAARPPKDVDDWMSDIYIPLTTSIIEAQMAEVIEQDLRPYVLPRGAEDAGKAKIMNAIIDYTWEKAKSSIALTEIIKDALILGTGIGMEYYWRQPMTIRERDSKGKYTEKKVLDYDDCYLEPVRLWDFFVDETAQSFSGPKQARDCVRRYIMDVDDFKDFFGTKDWDTYGNVKLVNAGGDTNYYEYYKPPTDMDNSHQVEVLMYWSRPMDLLAVVANDILITDKPNPAKHKQLPFVRVIDIKRPYQFYGKGEAELLESLQEENNTLRRMIIDRNHLDIDKPILVSDNLTIEDEDIIARPHGVIPVGDVNSAKPFEYSDIPLSVFKTLEMLTDDKVRVTGMDERQQGVQSSGTATEAAILKEQTIKRLNMKMWYIKNDCLIDLGRMRVENIMQYYTTPKLFEIVGEQNVAKAQADGTLVKKNGKNYRAQYRQIRLNDQVMSVNNKTKQPQIDKTNGVTFFEAKPEFFLPTHGGYDLKFAATETVPLSKPLQQQKADEMYDRLVKNDAVNQWELAKYLLETRDLDPDTFRAAPAPQGGQPGQPPVAPGAPTPPENGAPAGQPANQPVNLQQAIDLAGVENNEMIQGKVIAPTPYAPVVHTEVHIAFMRSQKFKDEVPPNSEVLQNFTNHVMGEITAQQMRGGQPGGLGNDIAAEGGTTPLTGGSGAQGIGAESNGAQGEQVQGGNDTANVSGAQS